MKKADLKNQQQCYHHWLSPWQRIWQVSRFQHCISQGLRSTLERSILSSTTHLKKQSNCSQVKSLLSTLPVLLSIDVCLLHHCKKLTQSLPYSIIWKLVLHHKQSHSWYIVISCWSVMMILSSQNGTTFMATYEEYRPRAVLCCQGHLFKQHILNVEKPHLFWKNYHNMRFFDESMPDDRSSLLPKPVTNSTTTGVVGLIPDTIIW